MGPLGITGLSPFAPSLVEGGACPREALPQSIRLGFVDADRSALMLLPLLEQRTELVGSGTPVRVITQSGGKGLGLLHNGGAFGDCLGHGLLAGFRDGVLLRRSLLAQLFQLRLECGDVAHDRRLLDFLRQRGERLVDLTGLDRIGLESICEYVEFGLEVEVTARVQGQCLVGRRIGELPHLTLFLALLHVYGAVAIHTAEALRLLELYIVM